MEQRKHTGKNPKMSTLVFTVALTMTVVQAIPIMNKENEKTNQLELIYVQTSVLEDVFYDVGQILDKYTEVCSIADAVNHVIGNQNTTESSYYIAKQQMMDTCEWVLSESKTEITCNTTTSSDIVQAWCVEIKAYADMKSKATKALTGVKDAFVQAKDFHQQKQEYRIQIEQGLPEYAQHFLQ